MIKSKSVLFARITEESDKWLTEHAQKQGISKNALVQLLINEAMKKSTA